MATASLTPATCCLFLSLFSFLQPAPARKDKCGGICPRNYDPVCGSDGRTYSNQCMMKFLSCEVGKEVRLERRGECHDRRRDWAAEKKVTSRPGVAGSDGALPFSQPVVVQSENSFTTSGLIGVETKSSPQDSNPVTVTQTSGAESTNEDVEAASSELKESLISRNQEMDDISMKPENQIYNIVTNEIMDRNHEVREKDQQYINDLTDNENFLSSNYLKESPKSSFLYSKFLFNENLQPETSEPSLDSLQQYLDSIELIPYPTPDYIRINPDPTPDNAPLNPDPSPDRAQLNPDPSPDHAQLNPVPVPAT